MTGVWRMATGRKLKTVSVGGKTRLFREKRSSIAMTTIISLAVVLAGCASSATVSSKPKSKRSKEYFAESKYGVKASPRVAQAGKPIQRGGGRDQTGRPYKVKGRWYYPKEDKSYKAVGQASWYGEAFHGRLTANGEVYDMTHLTAAHPTMPLPSYARVTNMDTGSSVIVRVNDRGPYEYGRVIDLSQKAADMLDYRHHGTAKVKVEYVGRAPLDGNDDAYLMASYVPAKGDPMGQPATGVMMAMNGPTPTSPSSHVPIPQDSPFSVDTSYGTAPIQPVNVPLPSQKPDLAMGMNSSHQVAGLAGYAPEQSLAGLHKRQNAYGTILSPGAVSSDWKSSDAQKTGEYVELGLFDTLEDVEKLQRALPQSARVSRTRVSLDQGEFFELTAVADKGDNDSLLRAAWKAGATNAFVVRAD